MQRTLQMLGLVSGMLTAGCAQIYNACDDHLINLHDRHTAKTAWCHHKHNWNHQPYHCDFRDGFRDGYFDALQGGGHCPPTLPPRKYWSVHNRGPDSAARVVAWYDGYVMGSTQALMDGAANRGRIVTAMEIYQQKPPVVEWPAEPIPAEPDPFIPEPGFGPLPVPPVPPAPPPMPLGGGTTSGEHSLAAPPIELPPSSSPAASLGPIIQRN